MATKYKLHYFAARARGEAIRYIFAYAGQSYEEHTILVADWPTEMALTPCGALPVLDVTEDDSATTRRLTQSVPIARYLGSVLALSGSDSEENYRLDAAVTYANEDIFFEITRRWFPRDVSDEDRQKVRQEIGEEMRGKTHPTKFANLVSLMGLNYGNRFILGERVAWADFCVAAYLEFFNSTVYAGKLADYNSDLGAYLARVQALPGVKEYIVARPVYDI